MCQLPCRTSLNPKEPPMTLHCCHPECDAPAEYEIREPRNGAGDGYTHSCLMHIPDLMTDATVHEVVKLTAPGNPTPVYL